MARVESQKTRQALLVVGSSMELSPPPEKLELFLPDGTPVDVAKDRTRARWRGTWDAAEVYEDNDFVLDDDKLYILDDFTLIEEGVAPSMSTSGAWVLMTVSGGMQWMGEWDVLEEDYQSGAVVSHESGLWVAPGDIEVGTEPGWEPSPPANIEVNRAVQFTEADRFASEEPVTITIGPGEGEQRRDNDITTGYAAVILIDVSGAEPGRTLNIKPISRPGNSASFTAASYYTGNSFDLSNHRTWSDAEVDSQTVKTMDISSNDDRFIH
ncbi:MAG TPA: hypothetical protein VEO92_06120, partial [Candidatus Nitrosocosmicus sp.]|nr:hypothetical protein [Candidatus Nitrosocosmicus sp.]